MSDTIAVDELVRQSLNELLSALTRLGDEVASARSHDWDERRHDVDAASRAVLTVSAALASALVDLMPQFDLQYDDLDEVFRAIAARLADPAFTHASEEVETLFQQLRRLSYDAKLPSGSDFPDIEDTNTSVERAVQSLMDMRVRHESV